MPIGELDLRRVRYFVAVAEELHFRRAAERLFISQPSLSQQIRRLEAEVGASLLSRGSRRVELTESGEAFLREARQLLAQAERTQAAARAGERLVVGFTGSAGARLLPRTLARFASGSPTATVVVRELDLGHLEDVVEGSVDVAFTRLQPGHAELSVEVLFREDRVVALAADHPLAKRMSIAFAELGSEPFITASASWDHAWRGLWQAERSRHGLHGPLVAEATSVEEIVTLVASKRGVCVMPATNAELFPRPGVVYVHVKDAEPALVSLVWRRGSETSLLRAFITEAKQSARGVARSS
jgi:DNA-binding transcriptional LysR family regulator